MIIHAKINSILWFKILISILALFILEALIASESAKVFAKQSTEVVVLEMETSHSRNIDRISLTFKDDSVEFVTNSFQINSQNKARTIQLGKFVMPMTQIMNDFKIILRIYYQMLTINYNNNLDSSNIDRALALGFGDTPIIPHAPILHLNNYRVPYDHAYFSDLRNIFKEVRGEEEWTCLHCAEYRKDGRSILRIVRKRGQREQRRTFSTRQLDCHRLDQERLECVDPEFGIFEIIM